MLRRSDSFVVLIVPERHEQVRRVRITRSTINRLMMASVAFLMLVTFSASHYAITLTQARRAKILLADNAALSLRLMSLQDDIDRFDASLKKIDVLAQRVRAITQLNDPARNLRMGPLVKEQAHRSAPVLYVPGERTDAEDEPMDSKAALALIEDGLDANRDHVAQTGLGLGDLAHYFDANPTLLATTPSIRPVASKLISGHFGQRLDPFTGLSVMHKGIDFVADLGAEVFAPADGRVIFCGARGAGYGDSVVLDHGFGVQTLYAHLQTIAVQQGELVLRGQTLASVGHSGRTTGAHLHYEVRYNGLPFDPERFLLD